MDPELSDWTTSYGPDAERLAALIAAHERDLRRVAVAITDDARRADAALLATWARARRRLGTLRDRSAGRAWLLRQVAREAERRRRPSWAARLRDGLPLVARRPPPPDPGRDAVLARILASLTSEDRRMLALRHAVGLTTEEIAAQLELTGAGVRTHLGDLREQLRDGLGISAEDDHGEPLTDRDVERRIAARLIAHLDRQSPAPDPVPGLGTAAAAPVTPQATAAARSIVRRTARRRRLGGPLLVGGVAVLAILVVAVPLSLGLGSGAGRSRAPTPSPGTFVKLSGWTQQTIDNTSSTLRVLGWAPDGAHFAVTSVGDAQVTIYDRSGVSVRAFAGTDAVWLDDERLLVLGNLGSDAFSPPARSNVLVRTVHGSGDLLVSLADLGAASSILGRGGAAAVALSVEFRLTAATNVRGQRFSILYSGGFGRPIEGIPLAWTPDGARLAYLASPSPVSGGYRGQLHLVDAGTLADRDLGIDVQQANLPAQVDPSGTHLLACLPSPTSASECNLGIVDLAAGTAETTQLPGTTAVAAWAADGSVVAQENRTILRWGPGDAPVAIGWQPDRVNPVLSMAALGDQLALGQLQGPPGPRLVAGVVPRMVAVPGPGVRSMAASPDGERLAYVQMHGGSSSLILSTVPPGEDQPPSAKPTASPGRSLDGMPILAPAPRAVVENPSFDGIVGVWGSHVYLITGGYAGGPDSFVRLELSVVDLLTNDRTAIDAPFEDGEQLAGIQTDGANLVLETFLRPQSTGDEATQCPSAITLPTAWRILQAPIGADGTPSGPFAVVDRGTAARVYTPGGPYGPCAMVQIPIIAVEAGQVAYAVEAPRGANPWASRILVRDVASGTILRDELTAAPVSWIGLDQGVLAWSEEQDRSAAGATPLTLHAAVAFEAPARLVDLPGGAAGPQSGWFTLGGGSVLYTSADQATGSASVWRIELASGAYEEVSPSDDNCTLAGAGRDIAFLRCWSTDGSILFVWRPERSLAVMEQDADSFGVYVAGGWAVTISSTDSGVRFSGFPLEDLLR